MRNFNVGPIIVLIIFILIPLANYVLGRMRRRFEQPKPAGQRMPDMGLRRQAAPAPTPTSGMPRERAQETPLNAILPSSQSRWSRRTLFRNRRDLRRVIVAMVVLGPCRAADSSR
jgi:hypothetical protein